MVACETIKDAVIIPTWNRLRTPMSVEEQFEIFYNYFSDDAIESLFNNLPQETLDELLQVVNLVEKKITMYKARIKELEEN